MTAIFSAAPAGWPQLAVRILLGTGDRVGELVNLELEDVEDDGEGMFLKIKRAKGGQVPPRAGHPAPGRETIGYVNRYRPDTKATNLLVQRDGRPLMVQTACNMLQRIRAKVGFPLHAHRFRHTFATEYLRRGGEMERLRRSEAARPQTIALVTWNCPGAAKCSPRSSCDRNVMI